MSTRAVNLAGVWLDQDGYRSSSRLKKKRHLADSQKSDRLFKTKLVTKL